jgi:hypothetical protein
VYLLVHSDANDDRGADYDPDETRDEDNVVAADRSVAEPYDRGKCARRPRKHRHAARIMQEPDNAHLIEREDLADDARDIGERFDSEDVAHSHGDRGQNIAVCPIGEVVDAMHVSSIRAFYLSNKKGGYDAALSSNLYLSNLSIL